MQAEEEGRLPVALHARSQDEGKRQTKDRNHFSCGGILPPMSLKIVPNRNQTAILFSLLFLFSGFGSVCNRLCSHVME